MIQSDPGPISVMFRIRVQVRSGIQPDTSPKRQLAHRRLDSCCCALLVQAAAVQRKPSPVRAWSQVCCCRSIFAPSGSRLLRRHANRSLHRQVKGVDAGKATNVPRAPAETGADDLASTSHGQLCFQRSLDSLAAGTSHLDFIPRVLVAQKLAGQAAKASMFQLVRCQP